MIRMLMLWDEYVTFVLNNKLWELNLKNSDTNRF